MVRCSRNCIEEEGVGRIICVLVINLMRAGKMKKYCLQLFMHAFSYFLCHDIMVQNSRSA